MEILPSRCALLQEHMECETGLCMHTGREPVAMDGKGPVSMCMRSQETPAGHGRWRLTRLK